MKQQLSDILKPTPFITCSSTWTGAGIVLQGYQRAGFTITAGYEFDKRFARISDANYKAPDGSSIINFGRPEVPVDVSQLHGKSINIFQNRKFGIPTSHLFEGGPTCDDYTDLNTVGDFGRRDGMLHQLRLIIESQPLVAVIEQSDKFLSKKHEDISKPYFEVVKRMPYRSRYKIMNAINYGGHHWRKRFIHLFVHDVLEKEPIFPEKLTTPPIRVRDFLDIDHFFSGHFVDSIKTRNHFMCAVTSGSPLWFEKERIQRSPTIEELMLCCDLDPAVFIMLGSYLTKRETLGNLMSPNLAYEIGKVIKEKILGYNRFENGLWISDFM